MGVPLNKVSEREYLGVLLTEDLELAKDSNRTLNSVFYANSMQSFINSNFSPQTF